MTACLVILWFTIRDSPTNLVYPPSEVNNEIFLPQASEFRSEEFQKALANTKNGTVQHRLNWIERGPGNVAGISRAILVDYGDNNLNTFYVGSYSGGLWKGHRTVDASGNDSILWTALTDQVPAQVINALGGATKKYPDVIYAGTGDGLYKSSNGGNTWILLENKYYSAQLKLITSIIVNPDNPDVVVVATGKSSTHSGLVLHSEDGGRSFTRQILAGHRTAHYTDLKAKPDDFNLQLATEYYEKTIWRSPESGKLWDLSTNLRAAGSIKLAFSQSHPNVVWAVVDVVTGNVEKVSSLVYRSDNAGISWRLIKQLETVPYDVSTYMNNQGFHNNSIAVHPFSPDTIYLGGVVLVKSWMVTDSTRDMMFQNDIIKGTQYDHVHVDHHQIITIPIDSSKNEFHILNANDGGFAYSRDGGNSWTEGDQFPGLNTAQFYSVAKMQGGSRYIGGMQDNGTWMSGDDPNRWDNWNWIGAGDGFDVVWKGTDSLLLSAQHSMYRSLDGGKTVKSIDPAPNRQKPWNPIFEWTPKLGNTVFTTVAKAIVRTSDFGESWEIFPRRSAPAFIKTSLADPNVIWAGSYLRDYDSTRTLWVSENALTSLDFQSIKTPDKPFVSSTYNYRLTLSGFATHPFDRATAYALISYSGPKIMRTTDMGDSWTDLSRWEVTLGGPDNEFILDEKSTNGFPNVAIWDLAVLPETPDILWAATEIGIVESRDNGESWALADNGLPAVIVYRIKVIDNEAVLATYGRGIWTVDLSEVTDDVRSSTKTLADVPASFELLANYPNPFNPTTTIGFNVSDHSDIRITVYDVLGRKVATLTDQPYAGGNHQIAWDASAMSSGQYFYRMEANGKLVGAKPMMLVK